MSVKLSQEITRIFNMLKYMAENDHVEFFVNFQVCQMAVNDIYIIIVFCKFVSGMIPLNSCPRIGPFP